jgi:transcriptional regulator with PAS, ATPase and Fis domain
MCDDNEISANDITFTSIRQDDNFTMSGKNLREYTIDIIKHYLKKNGNDVIATAKALDIGKSTIYKMMQDGELN